MSAGRELDAPGLLEPTGEGSIPMVDCILCRVLCGDAR